MTAKATEWNELHLAEMAPEDPAVEVLQSLGYAAVTYKETLDRLNAPESAVIMSAGHNDEARLARWHLRKDEQDRFIERFKDRHDPLAILVVCDMLLTGFDAPVEQVFRIPSARTACAISGASSRTRPARR